MKLLYITPYIPYPLDSGGNQAFYMMADHIRKQHDLSVLLYVHNSKERKYIEALQQIWDDVTFYLFEPKVVEDKVTASPYEHMSWLDRKACEFFDYLHHSMFRKIERRKCKYETQGVSNDGHDFDLVRARSTLFVGAGDLSDQFCQYVQEVSSKGFDIVQTEFYDYLPLVYLLPSHVKKVFVHHELRFVRNNNELSLFKKILPTDRLLYESQKAHEIACLSVYDAVITLTKIDYGILSDYIPKSRIYVSPAITQAVSFKPQPFKPATELVFIGSGDHFPNYDAMVWFCNEIVPIIKEKADVMPKINIIGNWNKDQEIGLKKAAPDVIFPGFVDDLQAFVNGKISIVPIRIGSGMRMKILDSIFAAAPLITTSKGCEGLPMVNEENCLIADDAESFAEAVVRIVVDKNMQEQLAVTALHSKTNMLNDYELLERRQAVYAKLI